MLDIYYIMIAFHKRNKGEWTHNSRIEYCFGKLKIHQLYANIERSNTVSLSLFEKNGFIVCGTKKEWLMTDSGWKDEMMVQLIDPDTTV